MRVLITGGLGFVGAALAKRLVEEGVQEVILFDLKKEAPDFLQAPLQDGRVRIFAGNLCNPQDVRTAVEGCDYVFHQAGLRVTQCAKDPRLAHEIMVDGTFHLAQACAEQKIKKVIHASSAIVYGEPLRLPLDENHPAHDHTFYGIFKIENEMLFRSFWKNFGLNYVSLRYFNIYGPGMNLFGSEIEVLVRWLDRMDSGEAPLIFGDGKQTLDYIFIDDIVEANWRALQADVTGEVFNVCTGRETSVLQLLELLLKTCGSTLAPEFREARAVNQVARRFGDPAKASRNLGFTAHVSLEEGLKKLVDWRRRVLGQRQKEMQVQSR